MSDVILELPDVKTDAVLTKDVYKNTIHPIMRAGTKLTEEHLNVLRLFAIKEITVKHNPTNPTSSEEEIANQTEEAVVVKQVQQSSFQSQYEEAVQKIKIEFQKWESGINPDIAVIRSIIVPLLEQLQQPDRELAFLTAVATKKDYIYHHSIAVGLLAYAIGEKMNLSIGEKIQIGIAGTLIDCGMAKMPPSILNEEGSLTTKEYNEVKKHPVYSYQMINESLLLRTEMKLAILQHHERLDGSGYPRGEKQDRITLYAQILGIADVYHARISDRIYRSKESPYKVLESFKKKYGTFNAEIINALYEVVGRLSIGTKVKLSNGEEGVIVYLDKSEPFRPAVKLTANESIVELTKMRTLSIKEILAI